MFEERNTPRKISNTFILTHDIYNQERQFYCQLPLKKKKRRKRKREKKKEKAHKRKQERKERKGKKEGGREPGKAMGNLKVSFQTTLPKYDTVAPAPFNSFCIFFSETKGEEKKRKERRREGRKGEKKKERKEKKNLIYRTTINGSLNIIL